MTGPGPRTDDERNGETPPEAVDSDKSAGSPGEDQPPATHHIAVLQQDNGELAEDVVHRRVAEQAERVVDSRPAPEAPERDRPDAPIPGTLPGPAEEAQQAEAEANSARR